MTRRYIDTGQTITRGTAFPLVLTLPLDPTDYTVTFTMRSSIADLGAPILQCDNTDIIHMNVSGRRVTVNLSTADTWKIPEKAGKVFMQVNLTKLADSRATLIYAFDVLPNIKEEVPAR